LSYGRQGEASRGRLKEKGRAHAFPPEGRERALADFGLSGPLNLAKMKNGDYQSKITNA
jgi:hypothetical protein